MLLNFELHQMHHQYDLSLVLACYNEIETFSDSIKQIIEVLDKTDLTYEIIFIDDGSQDNTPQLIKHALKTYPQKHLSAYFHQLNRGRGFTVSEGFTKAQGKVVGYIDIDLEIPAWYIPRFVELIDRQVDGTIAWRIYDINFNGLIRWVMSKGYSWLRKYLLNIQIPDTEAGYKFFNREKILPIIKKCHDHHWFWDTEMVAKAIKGKLNLHAIPVVFIRRLDKTSTVRLIPDTVEYLRQLIYYYRQLKIES